MFYHFGTDNNRPKSSQELTEIHFTSQTTIIEWTHQYRSTRLNIVTICQEWLDVRRKELAKTEKTASADSKPKITSEGPAPEQDEQNSNPFPTPNPDFDYSLPSLGLPTPNPDFDYSLPSSVEDEDHESNPFPTPNPDFDYSVIPSPQFSDDDFDNDE